MLSKRHDAHSIMIWLHLMMRAGAPKPRVVICDYSKALLYGMSREFNEIPSRKYLQTCFENLLTGRPVNVATHLRVDVAHILQAVFRSKGWKGGVHIKIKQLGIIIEG